LVHFGVEIVEDAPEFFDQNISQNAAAQTPRTTILMYKINTHIDVLPPLKLMGN
jgi:hypothetical protein